MGNYPVNMYAGGLASNFRDDEFGQMLSAVIQVVPDNQANKTWCLKKQLAHRLHITLSVSG